MALFLLTMTALTTGAPEMATTALPLLAPALATPPLLAPRAFVPVRLGVTMPSGWMRSQLARGSRSRSGRAGCCRQCRSATTRRATDARQQVVYTVRSKAIYACLHLFWLDPCRDFHPQHYREKPRA